MLVSYETVEPILKHFQDLAQSPKKEVSVSVADLKTLLDWLFFTKEPYPIVNCYTCKRGTVPEVCSFGFGTDYSKRNCNSWEIKAEKK